MLINFNHLKTFYSALKQKIKNSRGNWEQNDPTADDYIKNRPFYSEKIPEVVYVKERIIEGFAVMEDPIYAVQNPFAFTPVIGNVYKLLWDNNFYEVTAAELDGLIYIGNKNYVRMLPGGDIPFAIVIAGTNIFVVTESTNSSHKIGIFGRDEIVHQIDKKYVPIPDGIVTEDVLNEYVDTLAPVAFSNDYNDLDNAPALALVATSGSYNDLSNKPVIPKQEQANLSETDNTQASYVRGTIRQESLPEGYPYVEYTVGELVSSIANGTMTVTKNTDGTFSKKRNNLFSLSGSNFTDGTKYILRVGNNNCLCIWKRVVADVRYGYLYPCDDTFFGSTSLTLNTNYNGEVMLVDFYLQTLTPDAEGTYEYGLYKAVTTYYPISEQYIPDSLKQQVADLMYRPIEFDWFSSTPSVKEIGSTATSVVLDWRINKTPSSLALSSTEIDENGTTIDMTIDNNAIDVTLDKPITKSATFTLSATDEKGTVTKTAQIDFVNGAYFGAVSADQTIDSNFLLTSHRIERSLTSLKSWGIWTQTFENEHVIFALPSSYTAPVFYADGIRGGFHLAQTFDFTNASGYTESYDVWLSDNTNLGVMMFDVDCKEG